MRPVRPAVCLLLLCIFLVGVTSLPAQAAHHHRGKEFPLPASNSLPEWVTAGPDATLWYTDFADRIGRVTPSGTVTTWDTPPRSTPRGITAGPDGNVWFTEEGLGRIGRITPSGAITEFTVSSGAIGITAGPDG